MSSLATSPAATNGEEPLFKKQKKNQSLPDDLLVSCLARVSRLHYPTLSLVSKSFRSLLSSPELYKTRSLLGRTESCLYVCLRFPPEPTQRWFTLSLKPNRNVDNKKSSCNILVPIPTSHSHHAHSLSVVAVGCNIYNIGGSNFNGPSSKVSILNCQSHTWCEGPSMQVEWTNPSAKFLDHGKIYVAGGLKDFNSSNWMEILDPKKQTWEHGLASPSIKICGKYECKSAVIEGGLLYMSGSNGDLVYKPEEGKWEPMHHMEFLAWLVGVSYCVIGNVLYCYGWHNEIKWYDSKIGNWKDLKGLEGLLKFANCAAVRLADYGGKMTILWDEYLPSSACKNKMIWCAVIELERRNNEEIWGKVEWLDDMLIVPTAYDFVCALCATV